MNVRGLNRENDFGLGIIHDDSFSGRNTVCTPFNELREMGGLVYREKMEK